MQAYYHYMRKKLKAYLRHQMAYDSVVPPIIAELFVALRKAVRRKAIKNGKYQTIVDHAALQYDGNNAAGKA